MPRVLTGDDFVVGVRCLRQLWYRLNGPAPAGGEAAGGRAAGGEAAVVLHRAYRDEQYRRLRAVAGSPEAAEVRAYELTPRWRVSARVDEIESSDAGRNLVMLRPATSVKDAFIWEAAFADHVFSRAGAGGEAVTLRYLRKAYRRTPADGYDGLLIDADVTRRARGRSTSVPSRIDRMTEVLALPQDELLARVEPCGSRGCPVCAAEKSTVERLREVQPGGELSPVQRMQLAVHESGERHTDRAAIAAFLGELEYPVSFLDFEAYSEAVPTLAGTAPWEHVPVIYSLHRVAYPGAPPVHHVEAAPPDADGRAGLYRDLVSRLGERGSIVVYGKGFERRMLERLAAGAYGAAGADRAYGAAGGAAPDAEPVAGAALAGILPRLVDISRIFARGEYYDPRQEGSASLKAVYRAMIGGEYGDLEVADGRDANALYYFLRHGPPPGLELDGEAVLDDLRRYCSLDTEALVHIVEKLREVV